MATLKVTQVKSAIGTKPMHRGTLRALGLRGIGQNNILPDRPEIRGMIARVPHLITIEEIEEATAKPARRTRAATTPKAAE
jgi:large subunit ribosomal protein L30